MKRILILSILIATLSSCSSLKNSGNADAVMLTGQIAPLEMITFQYGTHILKSENKTYALRSSKVKLDNYVNKTVTIKSTKVSGCPLEDGPDLIDVSAVSAK